MAFENYFQEVSEAACFLKGKIQGKPGVALVLSGGLGKFADALEKKIVIPSSAIPHFPKAKAEGHKGELVFGRKSGLDLVCLRGRYHYYEGLSPQEVVFPYFVLKELGVDILITTNAVGGIRLDLNVGDVVAVEDHINHMGSNPLIGIAVQRSDNQFPSMQQAYDPQLLRLAGEVAKSQGLELKRVVYLGSPGPSYETPAEIRMFRQFGGDTVGMSTIFGVIAANYLNMRVLTFNIIANVSADRHAGRMTHSEVLAAMQGAESKVVKLLEGVVSSIAKLS